MEIKTKNYREMMVCSLGGMIVSLALLVTTLSVNTTCIFVLHQAKIPDSAKKLRKF